MSISDRVVFGCNVYFSGDYISPRPCLPTSRSCVGRGPFTLCVDLAIAVDAKLIVSRDKDLLSLRDPATIEGKDFMSRFPDLEILTPPEVLKLLDDRFSGE